MRQPSTSFFARRENSRVSLTGAHASGAFPFHDRPRNRVHGPGFIDELSVNSILRLFTSLLIVFHGTKHTCSFPVGVYDTLRAQSHIFSSCEPFESKRET